MPINFFFNRDSIYALYRKQKNGRRINLTYFPGIQINDESNPDRQRFNPKTKELEDFNKTLLEVEVAFNKVLETYDPFKLENEKLAELIEENMKNKPRYTPFFDYCDIYFEHASKRFTRRRSQQILTTINKIKDFSPNLTFEQIDKRFYQLTFDVILFLETFGDYVTIHCPDKKLTVNGTLKSWEEKLKGFSFMKVHRTTIVNLQKIDHIEGNQISIGRHILPIAEPYKAQLLEIMFKQPS